MVECGRCGLVLPRVRRGGHTPGRVVDARPGRQRARRPHAAVEVLATVGPAAVAYNGRSGPVQVAQVRAADRVVASVTVGYQTVVVGGPVRRVATAERAAAHPHAVRTEQLQEQPLELLAEYHVYHEIHGRVYGDQQVAGLHQLVDDDAVKVFQNVRHQRQYIAQHKHDHNAQQHGRQSDLLLLQSRQSLPFLVGSTNLQTQEEALVLFLQ